MIINPKLILGPLHLRVPVTLVNLRVMMTLRTMPTGIYPWEVQHERPSVRDQTKNIPRGFSDVASINPCYNSFTDSENRKILYSWRGMIFYVVPHLGKKK